MVKKRLARFPTTGRHNTHFREESMSEVVATLLARNEVLRPPARHAASFVFTGENT